MKRVYTAESLVDGQLLLDLLTDAGIPAELFHQNVSGGLGELPVTYPEIWVKHSEDEPRALHVIDRLRETAESGGPVCCARCGEINPSGFEICWQCHAVLVTPTD